MNQDSPSLDDLLASVSELLEELQAHLPEEARYKAQVGAFLLAVCRRELAEGPALAQAERARLAAFLGAEAPLPELRRRLCAAIRAGACDDRWDETVALALDHAAEKTAIVRPDRLDPARG